MAKNFSDKYLSNLKPQSKIYRIRESKGFAIMVRPSGIKTFYYIYEVGGKRKELNLGTYPLTSLQQAREKYNDAVKALFNNKPLVKEPETPPIPEMAVKDLMDMYIIDSKKDDTPRWSAIKMSIFVNKIRRWLKRPIASITKTDAIQLIDKERECGDGAMRNTYKALHVLFQYAEGREYNVRNPFAGMKKIKPSLKNRDRTRFLTEDEIKIVWSGLSSGARPIGKATRRALKLILVTAQRPGEVAGMHRREIQGDLVGHTLGKDKESTW